MEQIKRITQLKKSKKKKICFVASSGGHLEELLQLRKVAEKYDCFWVTERVGNTDVSIKDRIYYIDRIQRNEKWFVFHFFKLFFKAFCICNKEKPDCVITTGALAAFPFCLIIKGSRKKLIFIESFARIDTKSLTGRLVYPIADLFLVQWKEMTTVYPKATYVGRII